jgi:hypothetical protein
MDPKTKKIISIALGSIVGMWLMVMGWIAIGYFGDVRYEQQVRRWQLEEAQRSYKRAEQERKERLADIEERAKKQPRLPVAVGLSEAAAAAKWKREHPDGRAKSVEDLKGASLSDSMRNSHLMFPPASEAEKARAEQYKQDFADMARKSSEEQKERMAKLLAEDAAKRQAAKQSN